VLDCRRRHVVGGHHVRFGPPQLYIVSIAEENVREVEKVDMRTGTDVEHRDADETFLSQTSSNQDVTDKYYSTFPFQSQALETPCQMLHQDLYPRTIQFNP
jgi:hypothetical protein